MKKKFSLALMAAGMLLMTVGCSEETAIEVTPPTPVNNCEGVVRLALGGAVGKTTKTRAEGDAITAEDDEKTVESLYAVLFKDAVVSTEDGEDASDLFFKAINVTDSIYHDNDSVRFKVSSGDYQICFVANPSENLFDGLTAGSSSVANFKALVETKAPDTKPGMLMTSDFHKATVATNDSININTVTLERAMARIDIVNKADGITIDSVKLVNRAMNSVLINDGEKKAEALADTTYKDVSLAGKADGTAAYKANIYSYEQYGEGDNAPSLVVYYSIGTKNYTHTIDFKDNDDNQINLVRNHLYTVNITNAQGKLTFTLTVADWNKGTVFEVTSSELIAGTIDYTGIKVGDIMLKDGTYVSVSDDYTLTDTEKANAIGVVAYLYADGDTKTKPHGLVLALKSANSDKWGPTGKVGTTYSTLGAASATDGYTQTQYVLEAKSSVLSSYPAFNDIATYEASNPAPEYTSSGWYLPSIGEWLKMLGANGIGKVSSIDTSSARKDVTCSATTNINNALAVVGDDYCGKIDNKPLLWSSTEKSSSEAYGVRFYDSEITIGYATKSTGNSNVGPMQARYVFAF